MGEEKNARNIQFQDSGGKIFTFGAQLGCCWYVNHDSIVNGFGTIFINWLLLISMSFFFKSKIWIFVKKNF